MENSTTTSEAEERLKMVVKRIYDLPSFPIVIQKLQEVAEDPKSTSKKMAEVMEKDQGLSAKILKLVNSAFYSFNKPVSSLQHAITLLGYNSIRSLAMSVSMKSLLKVDENVFNAEKFWAHSLAVGTATRLFADHHRFPLKEDAFTAGLMHDVGILLEAKYFSDELAHVVDDVRNGGALTEAESRHLGVDHCLLGAWLAERWRLPTLLAEPMLRHHQLAASPLDADMREELEDDLIKVLDFVTVANMLAKACGYDNGLEGDGVEPLDDAETVVLELPEHLEWVAGERAVVDVSREFLDKFEAAKAFLAV